MNDLTLRPSYWANVPGGKERLYFGGDHNDRRNYNERQPTARIHR